MPDARRTHGLACKNKKAHEQGHHRYAEARRHSLRDGFNTYSTLFPAIGLFVTVIGAMRKHRRQLDASVEASSARFPKFVHPRGIFPRELRKGKGTSKFKIPVPLTI
jgi:hypothetical protein